MKVHFQAGDDPLRRHCLVWKDTDPENVTTDTTKVTCEKCLSMLRHSGRWKLIRNLQKWKYGKQIGA